MDFARALQFLDDVDAIFDGNLNLVQLLHETIERRPALILGINGNKTLLFDHGGLNRAFGVTYDVDRQTTHRKRHRGHTDFTIYNDDLFGSIDEYKYSAFRQ